MPVPAVSVAMSVYDGERFLDSAIASIRAQTFTDFEFLVLDDGSRDSSVAIARRHQAEDSRIRVIARENRGLIASLNQLFEEARAPLVARMDADDICAPERFARQVAFLVAHPDYGAIGCGSEDMDEDGMLLGCTMDFPRTHEDMLAAIEDSRQLMCHPAAMVRRDVVRAVGGYHAAFRHCEDLDLWMRLVAVTRVGNLPDRLIRYRRSPGQVSTRYTTEQQYGAAVARLAYDERRAGRPDPTASLDRLPPLGGLDALFGRAGVDFEVRRRVVQGVQYSPASMRGEGFDLLVAHLREGGSRDGLWRTVARLVRFGEVGRAARLAALLALPPRTRDLARAA